MLKMLKLPSSTTLYLICTSKTTHNDSEDLLLPVISAHFQSPAPVEFKSLTVTARQSGYMTGILNITASTFPSTSPDYQTQNFESNMVGNPELVLLFDDLSKPGHSTDLLKQACKMLPISGLEFISMSATGTSIIDINWVELFSCCTNVTAMEANGIGTTSLVHALAAKTVTNAGSSKEGRKRKRGNRKDTVAHAQPAIFPKLISLGLTELEFSESRYSSGIRFDVFERGLQQRTAASGAPLRLLRICGCEISAEHAGDLQKLVECFDWDGSEGLDDDDGSSCWDCNSDESSDEW